MQKYLILLFLGLIISSCKQEVKELSVEKELLADTLQVISSLGEFDKSDTYIDQNTGDTIYVDFQVELESNKEKEAVLEKYYIISSYSSYNKNQKLKEEESRWKELEPQSYLEEVKLGSAYKYFISLGKYTDKEDVLKVFATYKDKYPQEYINIQAIRQ